ncbi:MAG: C-terminal binding protein [Firmicutes bacterium]|nr:C-terminal binding protein [Bacillota bacterium]
MAETPQWMALALGHRFDNLDPEREVLEPQGVRVVNGRDVPWAEVLERWGDEADAIMVGAAFPINRRFIDRFARCRVIVRYGIGLDNVDLEAARARGIQVDNVTDYCVEEVANHAWAFILSLHRQLWALDQRARGGVWTFAGLHIPRLSSCRLGVVGFGAIGRAVVARARAFELKVSVFDPYADRAAIEASGADARDLDALCQESDILTLHAPLTPETHHLLDARRLKMLPPHAIVVNVARGPLIDERALAEALREGAVGMAGLDVFEEEPLPADSPLRELPNVVISPHSAWYSQGAQRELQRKAAEKVLRGLMGPTGSRQGGGGRP